LSRSSRSSLDLQAASGSGTLGGRRETKSILKQNQQSQQNLSSGDETVGKNGGPGDLSNSGRIVFVSYTIASFQLLAF
jgi:hypothetical protein